MNVVKIAECVKLIIISSRHIFCYLFCVTIVIIVIIISGVSTMTVLKNDGINAYSVSYF